MGLNWKLSALVCAYSIFPRTSLASDPVGWLADKSEDLSFDVNQRQDLLEGNPVLGAIAGVAVGRSPSPDSKFAVRKEHWRINPSVSVTSALNELAGIASPISLSVDVDRGVSFYRRYEPQLYKSILSMPLSPIENVPHSAQDVINKVPPGTIVHIPARTRVSFGKGYALSFLSEALKDTLDVVTLRDLVSASASFSVEAKYDLLISKSHENPKLARVQLIADKDESFTAGISTGLRFLLGDSASSGNRYGDKATQKGLSKITGKFLGQPIQLDFYQSGSGVRTVFDYTYDLNNPEAVKALNAAIRNRGPMTDLNVMRKVSAKGSSSVIHDIFSPAFNESEKLASDKNSGVIKKADVSTENSQQNSGWRLGINLLFRMGANDSNSTTVAHSGNESFVVQKKTKSTTMQGPLGYAKEISNEDLSNYTGFDPQGNIIDSYIETVYKYDFSDKNINEESVNRIAAHLRSRLGPDFLSYKSDTVRSGTTSTGLSDFLERVRQASLKGARQFYKGHLQFEFRISPAYLFLTRSELKQGALANNKTTQPEQHAYIASWVAYRMEQLAERMGVKGLFVTNKSCIDWVSKSIAVFLLLKDPPDFIDPSLQAYRSTPIGCRETYNQLALPTIIDLVNDRVEDPRYGPKFHVFAQADGMRKAWNKGEPENEYFDVIGQYQWVSTPLENRIGEVMSLQGQSLDPFAGLVNPRIDGKTPTEFVPKTKAPDNLGNTHVTPNKTTNVEPIPLMEPGAETTPQKKL